jgi:hypothetical protein
MPLTLTGVELLFPAPLPSWPIEPEPQHLACPPEMTAQVWNSPTLTCVALVMPLTVTGVELLSFAPFPS